MRIISIGLIQTSVKYDDPRKNISSVIDAVSTLSDIDILAIHENWILRKNFIDKNLYYDASFSVLNSSKARIFVAGSAYVKEGSEVFSKSVIIDRENNIAEGGKIFPSTAVGERDRVKPFKKPALYEKNNFSIGSVVCVDIMYPEITRYLALNGAEIIFNPSLIPSNRKYLWRSVASARSSENGVYVIHINATKTLYYDGRRVDGGSFITDPWGYVVFEADDREDVFIAEIDLDEIGIARSRWRYLEDIKERKWIAEI